MIHCCVGIMAYNEEANLGRLLEALLAQRTTTAVIDEIVVVASGCTDRTEEIVEEFAGRDGRIRLLRQARREGKASAVNLLIRSTDCEVVVLESADTLPALDTIEAMVAPFADPGVGMVGGRPVPTNPAHEFMGYAAHLVWELHHQISLRHPKMGEIIAFRNVFHQIPYDSSADEASIEPLIIGQGLRLHYAPEAVIRNRGPESVAEFVKRRRANYAGHLYVKDSLGYRVATMNTGRIAWLLLRNFKPSWRYLCWMPGVVALEAWVRLLATYDYVVWKRKPYTWSVAASTKKLVEVS